MVRGLRGEKGLLPEAVRRGVPDRQVVLGHDRARGGQRHPRDDFQDDRQPQFLLVVDLFLGFQELGQTALRSPISPLVLNNKMEPPEGTPLDPFRTVSLSSRVNRGTLSPSWELALFIVTSLHISTVGARSAAARLGARVRSVLAYPGT